MDLGWSVNQSVVRPRVAWFGNGADVERACLTRSGGDAWRGGDRLGH
jgi:hypothetical protein